MATSTTRKLLDLEIEESGWVKINDKEYHLYTRKTESYFARMRMVIAGLVFTDYELSGSWVKIYNNGDLIPDTEIKEILERLKDGYPD